MNSIFKFLLLSNGTSVPWADVPEWPADELSLPPPPNLHAAAALRVVRRAGKFWNVSRRDNCV